MHTSTNEAVGEASPIPALPRLERQRLHDVVVEHIRNFVVEGVLAPGIKLNEREICETLGISRTPLREALKVLAAEGLIEITPNRGATVSTLSETEIWEMFEMMSGLESLAGELAGERITAEEVAAIRTLHEEMLGCRAKNDLPGYYRCNQAIHDRINAAARNSILTQAYTTLNRRLKSLRFRSNLNANKWERAVQDHEEILQALDARDGKRLAAILRQHLLAKRAALMQADATRSTQTSA